MPNDAKLGLIAGVAVVLLIAAMFFRKEPGEAQAAPVEPAPAPVVAPVVAEPKLPAPPPQRTPPAPEPAADELPPLPPPPPLSESTL